MISGWQIPEWTIAVRTRIPAPIPAVLLALLCALARPTLAMEPPHHLLLATSLSAAGDHSAAALEFRRQALDAGDPSSRSALFWSAAMEYQRAGHYALAGKMLDASEDAAASLLSPTLLLRGETASGVQDWPSACFYFRGLAESAGNTNMTRYAARRLAVAELHRRNPDAARQALTLPATDESTPLASLDRYEKGSDKHPWLGGLLGMVPGLGYAYSGEYANAGRSLILNSLFLFGMLRTAEDENWGAFTAISFFELTWYSGSIYGGMDAAHRYNRNRLDTCAEGIMNNAGFAPEYTTLPVLTLQFRF